MAVNQDRWSCRQYLNTGRSGTGAHDRWMKEERLIWWEATGYICSAFSGSSGFLPGMHVEFNRLQIIPGSYR